MQDASAFGKKYATMNDDELLSLANQKDSLLPVAQGILAAEMQKRGLNEVAVTSYRIADEEAVQRETQQTESKRAAKSQKTLRILKGLGILVAAAIVTILLVSDLFSLSSEVVRLLTQASLSAALALSVWTGSAWWTFRRLITLSAGLSLCILAFVIYMVATAHPL